MAFWYTATPGGGSRQEAQSFQHEDKRRTAQAALKLWQDPESCKLWLVKGSQVLWEIPNPLAEKED